jgi:hypothetical protein
MLYINDRMVEACVVQTIWDAPKTDGNWQENHLTGTETSHFVPVKLDRNRLCVCVCVCVCTCLQSDELHTELTGQSRPFRTNSSEWENTHREIDYISRLLTSKNFQHSTSNTDTILGQYFYSKEQCFQYQYFVDRAYYKMYQVLSLATRRHTGGNRKQSVENVPGG